MKRIIRLTESDLYGIINYATKKALNEAFNQFSDEDFASTGDPYELGDDNNDPISDVSHITPNDLSRVYVWETGDSYYDFEAVYDDVSFRGSFDGDFTIDDVVIGSGGYGHQMNPNDVSNPRFEEWFNSTLGDQLAQVIDMKINRGDFSNEEEL